MALSKSTIIFNFNQAKAQANELDEIANSLSQLSTRDFNNAMQNIAANWKSENATIYLGKGERLQEDITSTANSLRNVASDIRIIAKRIYDAEMAAYERAKRRRYNK